jgi:hypothetical protein
MNEIIRQSFTSEPVPAWLEWKLAQRLDEHRARESAGLE